MLKVQQRDSAWSRELQVNQPRALEEVRRKTGKLLVTLNSKDNQKLCHWKGFKNYLNFYWIKLKVFYFLT